MQTRQKNTFLVTNTEYDILLNISATNRNIEMQDIIIRMFSWSVYVKNPLLKKIAIYILHKNIE